MTNRRRFLAISAAAIALPGVVQAKPTYTWRGVALGARATLRLDHPDAKAISARVAAEISRLEDVFSLYRSDSTLSQLNQTGKILNPPFELLECLSLAGAIHDASNGKFDPTIQPLWAAYAKASADGALVDDKTINDARRLIGWDRIRFDSAAITLRSGMALTLNGIAQGYIADRVAEMLSAESLTNILIDTGELRALGVHPNGEAWPVKLAAGGKVSLAARSLATSAPLGTTFDSASEQGHILDSRTGRPSRLIWKEISVSAKSAALADGLSTAACLLENRSEIEELLSQFEGTRLERISTTQD